MRLSDTAKPALDRPRNGLPEASLLGSKNDPALLTKTALNQVQLRARLRRQRHVECLHRLGPAPLGHFLREIELAERLERYALLTLLLFARSAAIDSRRRCFASTGVDHERLIRMPYKKEPRHRISSRSPGVQDLAAF
jgi:hypothetical protein